MDREAWQAPVHGVTKSWTQLKQLSMHVHRPSSCPSPLAFLWLFISQHKINLLSYYSPLQMNRRSTAAAAKSHQSCPTLCDPVDGSPPDSPVPGILQARILEWVAISQKEHSQPLNLDKSVSAIIFCPLLFKMRVCHFSVLSSRKNIPRNSLINLIWASYLPLQELI